MYSQNGDNGGCAGGGGAFNYNGDIGSAGQGGGGTQAGNPNGTVNTGGGGAGGDDDKTPPGNGGSGKNKFPIHRSHQEHLLFDKRHYLHQNRQSGVV